MAIAWPRRPRLVAGNWKMHKTPAEGVALARELVELLRARGAAQVAVCPPYPALEQVGAVLKDSRLHLGAQNVHAEPQGAFTGEVSVPMLKACGCRFAIVGHSERRHGMGEDDAAVAKKLRAALRDGLTPIVCVGETLDERESGATADRVTSQTRAAFASVKASDAASCVVAYEPIWAIGTGRNATPEDANETIGVIRGALRALYDDDTADAIRIQYGGSVKSGNAAALMAMPEIDGALVGGASLDPDEFARIVQYHR